MSYVKNLEKNRTFDNLLRLSHEHYGEHPALAVAGSTERFTYAQVAQKVAALQELLRAQGVHRGDKVALLGENMPQWGMAYLAVTAMGAVVVPILADFHPNEIRHILRHSEAKALFLSERFEGLLEDESFDDLTLVLSLNRLELFEAQSAPNRLKSFLKSKSEALNRLKKQIANEEETPLHEEDLAAIIYTSGTTGHSKGVMLSHKNIISNAIATKSVVDISSRDTFLSVLPLAHVFECTVGFVVPFVYGASIYYVTKAPTPKILMQALSDVRPSFMLAVPLIIEKIHKNRIMPNLHSGLIGMLYKIKALQKPLHRLAGKKLLKSFGGNLRFFGIGGAKLSAQVERFLREAHFPYAIGYGLTETAPILAGAGPDIVRFRSTGPALEGVKLKLVDINEETQEGEIVARGPNVMMGYYKDEALTKEVLKDGWFYTGDLGLFDEDGHLTIKGRSKNVILGPSGENIYPESIESVINAHALVVESLVYEEEGKLAAKVFLDYDKIDALLEGKTLSESQARAFIEERLESIRRFANENVSGFSRLHRCYEHIEEFEKTPTKKIKRFLYV